MGSPVGGAAWSDDTLLASNASGIYGGVGPAPNGSPGHVTVYVSTDYVAGSLRRAGSLGATTTHPPMKIPEGGGIALFSDPAGHTIGLDKRAR